MESATTVIWVAIIGFIGTLIGAAIATFSQWFISKRERVDKFKLAALERRLAAHQEAYSLWTELVKVLHKPEEKTKIVLKCQDWWSKNCLYLDSKSRKEFKSCYTLAFEYEAFKDSGDAKEVFKEIMDTGKYLVEGVNLPSFGDKESERIDERK